MFIEVDRTQWDLSFKKFYHNSAACDSTSTVFYKKRWGGYIYDKAVEALYKNRIAPVKPFKGKVVNVCKDLLSSTALNAFFKELKGKGGIYMFTLSNNPNIFYIGKAKDFQKRFKSHLNIKLNLYIEIVAESSDSSR